MKIERRTHMLRHSFRRCGFPCIVLVVSILSLTGCEKKAPEQVEVVRPVKMMTLGELGASGILEYPGTIAAARETEMTFEVTGKIVEFPVMEGQNVAKGELLARLDDHDLRASRDADRAKQRAAKADYERYQDLYAKNAVSLQELEIRQRQFEVTDATLKRSEKALRDARLVAPFNGRVARTLVENYENIKTKQPVLLLQDLSHLEIIVNVPEQDAARARRGMSENIKAIVTLSSIPGREFTATFKELATAADPVTRTFKVTFAFENPTDVSIFPGMTAKLRIDAGEEVIEQTGGSFSIPSVAVVADENGNSFVWIVDTSTMVVSRCAVVLGEMEGTDVEIQSGLSSGETIVVSGAQNLRDGMKVSRFGN